MGSDLSQRFPQGEKPGTASFVATQFASTVILHPPVFRDDHDDRSSEHSDVRRVVLGQQGCVDPATPAVSFETMEARRPDDGGSQT